VEQKAQKARKLKREMAIDLYRWRMVQTGWEIHQHVEYELSEPQTSTLSPKKKSSGILNGILPFYPGGKKIQIFFI
jgi:hypothetical protein